MTIKAQMTKALLGKQAGSILPTVAVGATAMILAAALAIDIGNFYESHRKMQLAADAAALAGALQVYNGTCTSSSPAACVTAGTNVASQHGYTSNVAVNYPAKDKCNVNYNNSSRYLDVVITPSHPWYFSSLGFNNFACAVATIQNDKPPCILATHPTWDSVQMSGNAKMNLPDCTILSNSNGTTAPNPRTNCPWYVNGDITVESKGNYSHASSCIIGNSASIDPPIENNRPVMDDPWSSLIQPSPTSCDYFNAGAGKYLDEKNHQQASNWLTCYTTCGNNNKCKNGCTPTPSNIPAYPTAIPYGTWCGGITLNANNTYYHLNGSYNLIGGGMSIKNSGLTGINSSIFYSTTISLGTAYAAMPGYSADSTLGVSFTSGGSTQRTSTQNKLTDCISSGGDCATAPTVGGSNFPVIWIDKTSAGGLSIQQNTNAYFNFTGGIYIPCTNTTSCVLRAAGTSTTATADLIGTVITNVIDISGNGTITMKPNVTITGSYTRPYLVH